MKVRISAVASVIPEQITTSGEVEEKIILNSRGVQIPRVLEMVTGIRTRRYVDETINTSDLAAEACRKILSQTNTPASEIDLLVFASAGQDLIEPATSHITQDKLGTNAAVMDVKNACNSFINGLQVAEALILAGQYKKVLVATGETPSRCIKWGVSNKEDLRLSFPGYTFGDAGAAVLLEPSTGDNGIFYRKFGAVSKHWNVGTLAAGGSMHPRGDEYTYFRGDGKALKDAFVNVGPCFLNKALAETGTTFADFTRILVHQVSIPFLDIFLRSTAIPRDKVVITLPEFGNMAAASLPVAFALAESRGEIKKGDNIMLVGLAGGLSLGIVMLKY